ncbi:MAG TPA: S1C family serine protease [Candidatus Nanoarchaeia archaeon]|nr:S1C family serine protease [Candidatus Nanoarchaeia archaeon]
MRKRGLLIVLLLVPMVFADLPVSQTEAIAAFAKPAVARIETEFLANVERPGIAPDGSELPPFRARVFVRTLGSGFIIRPDGYLITNSHVVTPSEDDSRDKVIWELLRPYEMNPKRSEIEKIIRDKAKLIDITTSKIEVMLPAFNPITNDVVPRIYVAEVKKEGAPYPGKDIAVLKIPAENLPTVKFGSTDHLKIGSDVTVIGFPGTAELTPGEFEPTVTSGIVSAVKNAPTGWKVLQFDVAIAPGSSGSAVFDKSGNVVGVATLGSPETQGFNWFIPAEVAKEFLLEGNVVPERGVVDDIYERALTSYWNQRYLHAIDDFRIVQELYPGHPFVPEYVQKSRTELARAEAGVPTGFIVSLFGALLIFIVGFLVFFVFKEKKEIMMLKRRIHHR